MNKPIQINRELMLLIKAQILKEPRQFVMQSFFSSILDELGGKFDDLIPTNCGTAACIAGWAIVIGKQFKNPLEARRVFRWNDPKITPTLNPETEGQKLLGLSHSQANDLFFVQNWPENFQYDWFETKSIEERAQVAANVIDHFLQNN
jgi:hypothetical protein